MYLLLEGFAAWGAGRCRYPWRCRLLIAIRNTYCMLCFRPKQCPSCKQCWVSTAEMLATVTQHPYWGGPAEGRKVSGCTAGGQREAARHDMAEHSGKVDALAFFA